MNLDYDAIIPKLCPGYARALEEFSGRARNASTVVDLGVGAGIIAHHILRRSQYLAYYGVDIDGDAIKRARERLKGFPCILSRLDFTDWELPLVDTYVSSLSIHHLEHPKQEALFERIAKSSERFMHFELIAPESESEGRVVASVLETYVLKEAQKLGLGAVELQQLKEKSAHDDKPMKLSDHVRIHEKLGRDVDVVFKEYCFAFYATSKR
jgi:ubiquinone/menaquinone biosynthesis C-methylase UbiE